MGSDEDESEDFISIGTPLKTTFGSYLFVDTYYRSLILYLFRTKFYFYLI